MGATCVNYLQSPIMLVDSKGAVRPLIPTDHSRVSLRLFCFPHAGGMSSVFYPWAKRLPPTIEMGVIQLPGRGARIAESPLTELHSILAELMSVLRECDQVPFALFGHSMGALLAYELARTLTCVGISPRAVFVSAACAPQTVTHRTQLHRLPNAALIQELAERYHAVPVEILNDDEAQELFLPALRADLELLETYAHTPGVLLECPIFAFGGKADPEVTSEDLLRWREQTQHAFRVELFPGGHFYLYELQDSFLQALNTALMALMDGATSKTPLL